MSKGHGTGRTGKGGKSGGGGGGASGSYEAQATKAKAYFDRLSRDFPRSEAARRVPGGRARTAGPQESP